VGPADFRGTWLALLHRTPPCAADRAACLDRLDVLAHRLAEHDCRLLVAVDAPSDVAERWAEQTRPDRATGLLIGTWLAEVPPPAHAARLALVDPAGVLRAFEEATDDDSAADWELLARADRALDVARPSGAAPCGAERVGCVDWFDYARAERPGAAP
jgi:hypothetical protein